MRPAVEDDRHATDPERPDQGRHGLAAPPGRRGALPSNRPHLPTLRTPRPGHRGHHPALLALPGHPGKSLLLFRSSWKLLEILSWTLRPYMSTVPHPEGQSRIFIRCPAVPRNQQMSRIFRKWYYFFFRCRLFYMFASQRNKKSDELRIKIGSKFARRQATDYKYTVL